MKKAPLFVCLTLLLWGTPVVLGQDNCMPCDPCGGQSIGNSPFTFGGWVEMGIYTNGNGGGDNGPMHSASKQRTDFQMSQVYLFGEKEMDTRRGVDWGGRADLVYGVDQAGMQCFGDETFDFDWGTNKHGYGLAAYQLYGTLGYKDWSVKVGKFGTTIGWEESAAKENIFYSHSYCYWIEPATHTGALATYNMTDRLSLNAGWTTGMDSSFKNPNDNSALLTGFTYSLSDKATAYYWINKGKQFDDATSPRDDYFVQSLCFEWLPTDKFTYVLQYNLRNDNVQGEGRYSAYGINNHFLYALTETLTVGTRLEWLRDNGGVGYFTEEGYAGDYGQVTFGLRWDPRKHLSIRPEVRYDWYKGDDAPFGAEGSKRKEQVSGGCGVLVSF
jgi:hypothetical protein